MKISLLGMFTVMLLTINFASAADMKCNGTEPFWSVSVKNGSLTYDNPSNDGSSVRTIESTRDAAGTMPGYITVIKTASSTLTVVAGTCNDGMSDNEYSHHAVFDVDGTVFGGCCNAK